MDNTIDFNGHTYALDLKRVMEFIYGNPEKKLNYETTIMQSYGYPTSMPVEDVGSSEMQLISKETTESKSSMNDVLTNVRYDFLKFLFGYITGPEANSFLSGIAFNTLYNEKIIIDITNKNGK